MDGTETGWGRPTESPPRWRALFDRTRSGRAEPSEPDDDGIDNGVPGDPRRRQPGGHGQQDWRDTGQPGFFGGPQPPPDHATPDPGSDAGYPGASRYAILQNGYRPEPHSGGESRYSILENGYRPGPPPAPPPPAQPAAPGPAATPGPAPIPGQPGQLPPAADRGFHPEPAHRREPRYPAPPERGNPREPDYRALGRGYRSTIPTQPAPAHPPPGPPAVAPSPAPARPAPPPPGRKILDPEYGGRQRWGQRAAPAPAVHGQPANRGQVPNHAQTPDRAQVQTGRAKSELERAASVLRRELGTPRVLAFANPKGGVHKTTATVLAAATVGGVRGRGVLAWDDNELRGTLGLRAGSARHARTIRHLVADLIEVEALPGPQLIARLDDYLRHASDGSYDVLAGEESPRFAQRLDQHTVRRVLELLRRTHDVICVDTGNNVESANWQTVLQAADQLVVTTVPREDAAFTADWMLDLLHEIGMSELADNAVTLLSCPTPGRSPLMGDLERHFATRTRAVAVVPYDPALETGSSIEYDQVQPETREAWLLAAATMLEPFAR